MHLKLSRRWPFLTRMVTPVQGLSVLPSTLPPWSATRNEGIIDSERRLAALDSERADDLTRFAANLELQEKSNPWLE